MRTYLKQSATDAGAARSDSSVQAVVSDVIAAVRDRGDDAVRDYSAQFDNWSPDEFRLSEEQVEEIVASVDPQIIEDIRTVQANVRDFAQRQLDSMHDIEVETQPGEFTEIRVILPRSAVFV